MSHSPWREFCNSSLRGELRSLTIVFGGGRGGKNEMGESRERFFQKEKGRKKDYQPS
jgi:hypothetical protein